MPSTINADTYILRKGFPPSDNFRSNACVDRYLKHLEYWKIVLMIPLIQKKISQLIHENQHVKITTSKRQGSFLLGAAQTSLSTLKSNRLSDRLFTCTNGLPQISSARVEIPKIRCMESIYARDLQQNVIPQYSPVR